MKTTFIAAFSAALLVGGFTVLSTEGQKTSPGPAPLVIESMYGPDLYRLYCATSICYALDPSDARVKARISSLVAHIASIQQK